MFNPVYPFTMEVLQKTVARGCTWFVRNTWPAGFDHFSEDIKGTFIITHYNDKAKALAHYNSISNDPYRFLYDWDEEEHKAKLKTAASGPAGYKVFSSYFLDDYKTKITNRIKDKINHYMYKHTSWKPVKGETVHVDFYLQFGMLFITMRYGGQQISIKFEEIEKQV